MRARSRTLAVVWSFQQNLLTISGECEAAVKENANYYRKERYDGSFRRLITLPYDVDPDRVDAQYNDGVLRIHIKRREATRPRQIEVKYFAMNQLDPE